MTVANLVGACNNVSISTRVFIEDTVGRILHDANELTIKPEIMVREVQSFGIDGDTLYMVVF